MVDIYVNGWCFMSTVNQLGQHCMFYVNSSNVMQTVKALCQQLTFNALCQHLMLYLNI